MEPETTNIFVQIHDREPVQIFDKGDAHNSDDVPGTDVLPSDTLRDLASPYLRCIKDTVDRHLDSEKNYSKRLDVYIDGEKCSEYLGMEFVEQFFGESEDDGVHLIQVWAAPLVPGQAFSVIKKVLLISDSITSYKLKRLGSTDNYLWLERRPPNIKQIHNNARKRRRV